MIKIEVDWGQKVISRGISGHGMFKPFKYLGHIHYICPISGRTNKKDRFQSKTSIGAVLN